jgi:VanZ family protein
MMSPSVRRAWLLSLLWIGIIVVESAAGSAENTGRFLYPLLKFLYPKISALHLMQIHFTLRKAGHFLGYCVLSFTLYRSWWVTLAARTTPDRLSWRNMFQAWNWRAALLALIVTLLIAGSDEWHQSYNPARGPSLSDVALDEFGGVLAQMGILMASSIPIVRRMPGVRSRPTTSV